MGDQEANVMPSDTFSLRKALVPVVAALFVFLVICIVLILFAWRNATDSLPGNLWVEVGKASLQVIGVVVIGGAVGVVTFYFQRQANEAARDRQNIIEGAARDRQNIIEGAARDRQNEVENWQRHVDRITDKRHRKDAFLTEVLNDTLTAYHAVKRVRRLLDAETRHENGRSICIDAYDRHLRDLNNQQLAFEGLKRIGPICDEETDGRHSKYKDSFKSIESYLNKIVDEYQENRHLVHKAGDAGVNLADLERLWKFVATRDFREGVSHDIDKIIEMTQRALLEQIALPPITSPGVAPT